MGLQTVNMAEIRENPVALRSVNKASDSFREIVDSVKREGILNAITVREKEGADGKRYEIIDGLHRFTAAQEANLDQIPANVLTRDDAGVLITQIIGNVQRVETKPTEYARGLLRILAAHPTMTEAQLATMLSKSPAWIGDQLGLPKLDDKIAKLVDEGRVPLANAYPLTKLPVEEQINWLERAMTMPAAEFGPKVQARKKEIQEANRKGKSAEPESFVAVMHLRKKGDIEAAAKNPAPIVALVNKTGAKDPASIAKLALEWALNYDPDSQAEQKRKFDEHQKAQAEAKERRKAEQQAKRAKEAKEAAEKAGTPVAAEA